MTPNLVHHSRRKGIALLFGLLGAVALASIPATGVAGGSEPSPRHLLPGQEVFDQAQEVPDSELGEMRGRFVSFGQVLYFGIEMVTQWATAAGEIFRSGVRMVIDWASVQFRPNVTVERIASYANSQGSGTASPASGSSGGGPVQGISSGGLNNAQGVVQVVQVTGDDNSIHNRVNLAVNAGPDNGNTPDDPGVAAAGGGTQSVVAGEAQAVLTTSVGANNLEVSVEVPGQGVARQSLGNIAGLLQSVQVGGDMNRVLNMVNLTAQLNSLTDSGRRAVNIQSALQSLRGL